MMKRINCGKAYDITLAVIVVLFLLFVFKVEGLI